MDFEQTFDNIVFGKSIPKLESCLGLYLSPDVMYLSEVRLKGGKPSVNHLIRIPNSQLPEAGKKSVEIRTAGSLNTEILSLTDRLAGKLKPALDQIKSRSPYVVLSLSSHFGLLRYFTIPPMDRRFWRTAVPAEARKLIPIPFGDLAYDFQVRPIASGSNQAPRYGALFGVVHRKNLENLAALMRKLGLTLVGVELATCSVERFWDTLHPAGGSASYAQVHLEGGDAYVVLSQDGWPTLFRTVQLPPDASQGGWRRVDLSGSIDFALKQLGARPPAQIRLSGTHRDLKGWAQALNQETGVPAVIVESAKQSGFSAEEWGAYASAGGALRYIAPTAVTMEMSQYGRTSEEDRRTVYTLFSLVGCVAAILTMLGGMRFVEGVFARSELSRLRRQVNTVQEFRNKNTDEIQKLTKEVENKVNTIGILATPKPPLMEILKVVQEDIPEPAWIDHLAYGSPVGDKQANIGRTLSLYGNVAASNVDAEQDAINQFHQKLGDDERFGKYFLCGTPSVQITQGKDANQGRTTFSIACMGKAGSL